MTTGALHIGATSFFLKDNSINLTLKFFASYHAHAPILALSINW